MKTAEELLREIVSSLDYEYYEIEESCPEALKECKEHISEYTKQLLEEYTNRIVENVDLTDESYQSTQEGSVCQIDKESITSQLPKFLKEKGL